MCEPNRKIAGTVVDGLPMANKVAGNPLVSVGELQATLGAEPLTGLGWNALAFAPNCNVPLKRSPYFQLALGRNILRIR